VGEERRKKKSISKGRGSTGTEEASLRERRSNEKSHKLSTNVTEEEEKEEEAFANRYDCL